MPSTTSAWSRPALLHLGIDIPELAEEARRCEAHALFSQYGQTRQELDEEFQDFEADSVFLTLADEAGHVVAAARLIAPSHRGPKLFADLERGPWDIDGSQAAREARLDLSTTWDIATLSRLPEAGSMAGPAIYHGLHLAAGENRMSATLALLNVSVRRLLGVLGLRYEVFGGAVPAPFDGSPASVPVYARYAQQVDNARRLNPDAYRLVILGIGLSGVAVPDRRQFRLQRPGLGSQSEVVDLRERVEHQPTSVAVDVSP